MGWPVFGLPPWKKYRRRDRDHLVPPRRMDAAPDTHQAGRRRRRNMAAHGAFTAARADETHWHARWRGSLRAMLIRRNANAALTESLQQLGWRDGRNVPIDHRHDVGAMPANVRKFAAELIALEPEVVLASGAAALAPLLQAPRTGSSRRTDRNAAQSRHRLTRTGRTH